MSARTEFVVADMAEFWAAIEDLQQRVATLERLVETLVNAKLTASQNDADLLRTAMRLENELQDVRDRPAALEKGQSPYNRFVEPAPLWGDSTDPGSTIRKRRQKP